MAVTRVKFHPERDADITITRNNLLREVVQRRYTSLYTVWTSTDKDGPVEIRASPLLPVIGSSYAPPGGTADPLATCVRISPRPTKNRRVWHVTYEFDTERYVALDTEDPLAQPPEVSWDIEHDERATLKDAYGADYQSSSLNPYDPPQLRRYSRPVLRVVRNQAAFDRSTAQAYWDTINAKPFAGYPQGHAKILSITGRRMFTAGQFYWQVTYEIGFNPYSWYDLILDQDWRDVDGKKFLDYARAQALDNQSPLNGRGRSLYSGANVAILKNDIVAGDTSFQLSVWQNAVRFPLPPNAPIAIPGAAGATYIPGPHAPFEIMVSRAGGEAKTTRVEPSNRDDVVYPGKANAGTVVIQDLEKPIVVATPSYEIMLVTNVQVVASGNPAPNEYNAIFTVTRAQRGTTARSFGGVNGAGGANGWGYIEMLPYYRRFIPYVYKDFDALSLPTE